MTSLRRLIAAAFVLCSAGAGAQVGSFSNPIISRPAADPSIAYVNGVYYSVRSGCAGAGGARAICIRSATSLPKLSSAAAQIVWSAPEEGPNVREIWAPEIEFLDGHWYIYFAADPDGKNDHRLFALQPRDNANPLGSWVEADTGAPHGALVTDWKSTWAIDPNVFKAADNHYYLLYSCRQDNSDKPPGNWQSICLAAMRDPLHLKADPGTGKKVVELSIPTQAWEKRGFPTQEGPFGVSRDGIDYVFYSGSFSGNADQYTVGVLVHDHRSPEQEGLNSMMNPAAWIKKGPLFDGHHAAYGTASTVLIPSPDGTEVWNVYHGTDCNATCPRDAQRHTWPQRSIRAQKAEWSGDGELVMGYPVDILNEDGVGAAVPLKSPSTDHATKPFAAWGAAFGDAAEGDMSSGQPRGSWNVKDARTITSATLDAEVFDRRFFNANPNWLDYVVYTKVRWLETGVGDAHPKYGVYAAYVDKDNWLAAMIDVNSCGASSCVTTGGKSRGAAIPWKNCALPSGFDKNASSVLAVEVSHGNFTVLLNGEILNGGCQRIHESEVDLRAGQAHDSNGQAGVVVENTRAEFTDFNVSPGIPRDSADSGQQYTFRNMESSLYLDGVCNGRCPDRPGKTVEIMQREPIATYPLTRDRRQLWVLRNKGNGWFTIGGAASELCLADARGDTSNGHKLPEASNASNDALLLESCNGSVAQNWRFIPVAESSSFIVQNRASGLVLETRDKQRGSLITASKRTDVSGQKWELTAP